MLIGGYYYGVVGLIAGASASKILSYPFLAGFLHRHNVWLPSVDIIAFIACVCLVGVGITATNGIDF